VSAEYFLRVHSTTPVVKANETPGITYTNIRNKMNITYMSRNPNADTFQYTPNDAFDLLRRRKRTP